MAEVGLREDVARDRVAATPAGDVKPISSVALSAPLISDNVGVAQVVGDRRPPAP